MKQRPICVAQTCPARGDVERNLEDHVRLVRLAAGLAASVIVFPELSLTGYELDLADALAMSEEDPRLAKLSQASSSYALTIVAGAPVRIRRLLHNGAFVLLPDGSRSLYTKQHLGTFDAAASCDGTLPPPEPSIFQPGDRDSLVHLDGAVAAIAICSDSGRPSHVQRAAERGARAYLVSMFVIPSEFDGDCARLGQYAADHSMIVAFANFGSSTGGLASAGRSSIWSPDGVLRARLPSSGAGIALLERTSDGWRGETVLLA
jgi:predicted amidohydrolase